MAILYLERSGRGARAPPPPPEALLWAAKHFQRLADEDRALPDAWDDIARLILGSALLAAAVWAVITGVRRAVHDGYHLVEHSFDAHPGLWGSLALLAILGVVGTLRGLLTSRASWADASGDGMDLALSNYHSTYADEADDPQPRYRRPAFGLAARKAVTTGLTLGGDGSAGVLIPIMYLGGLSGALTARLLVLGGLAPAHLDPALFALVAVIGVPLAAITLVLEVFGAAFGPPAILACGLTYLFTLRLSIYESQRLSPDPTADETGGVAEADQPRT